MESEWRTCKLSDVANVIDSLHKTPEYVDKGIPMVRVTDIKAGYLDLSTALKVNNAVYEEFTKKHKPSLGDIVISRVGTYGIFSYVSQNTKFCLGQNTALIVPQIDSKFLYYSLMSPITKQFLESIVTGSTQKTISLKNIKSIPIMLPPKRIQKFIADILSVVDDKIELNQRINDNLEQQARLLFQSWYVDFEPFGGSMPLDWEIVPLDVIADFQNGYAFKSKELLGEATSNTYRVFKQGHINRGGGFNANGTKSWYPKESASKLNKYVLHKGDILMAMTDMKDNVAILGNTAIMPIDNEYIVNQRVGILRANGKNGIAYPFIYLLTNSKNFITDLRSRANSGVQVNLSSAEIKASETILAPLKINIKFSAIVTPMIDMILQNQIENEKLIKLRDSLLPKIMSGEIDVSDAKF